MICCSDGCLVISEDSFCHKPEKDKAQWMALSFLGCPRPHKGVSVRTNAGFWLSRPHKGVFLRTNARV